MNKIAAWSEPYDSAQLISGAVVSMEIRAVSLVIRRSRTAGGFSLVGVPKGFITSSPFVMLQAGH